MGNGLYACAYKKRHINVEYGVQPTSLAINKNKLEYIVRHLSRDINIANKIVDGYLNNIYNNHKDIVVKIRVEFKRKYKINNVAVEPNLIEAQPRKRIFPVVLKSTWQSIQWWEISEWFITLHRWINKSRW